MTIDSAPCHAYHPLLGSGLQWEPGRVKLWIGGEVVATAVHTTASAREFFYNLGFVECFPGVASWWMRSEWAGRVRVSAPFASDGVGIMGIMQFDSEEAPALPWMVDDGAPVEVAVPLPPGNHHANLFLKLKLARLVIDILASTAPLDVWMVVTNTVARDQLDDLLPNKYPVSAAEIPVRLTIPASDSHFSQTSRWVLVEHSSLDIRALFLQDANVTISEPQHD